MSGQLPDNRRNAPRRRKAVPDTRRDLQQRVVVRPAEQHFHDPPVRRGLRAAVIQDNLQPPHRYGETLRLARVAISMPSRIPAQLRKVHFPDLPNSGEAGRIMCMTGPPFVGMTAKILQLHVLK